MLFWKRTNKIKTKLSINIRSQDLWGLLLELVTSYHWKSFMPMGGASWFDRSTLEEQVNSVTTYSGLQTGWAGQASGAGKRAGQAVRDVGQAVKSSGSSGSFLAMHSTACPSPAIPACLTHFFSNSSAQPEVSDNAFVLWEQSWKNGGKLAVHQSYLNWKDCTSIFILINLKKDNF